MPIRNQHEFPKVFASGSSVTSSLLRSEDSGRGTSGSHHLRSDFGSLIVIFARSTSVTLLPAKTPAGVFRLRWSCAHYNSIWEFRLVALQTLVDSWSSVVVPPNICPITNGWIRIKWKFITRHHPSTHYFFSKIFKTSEIVYATCNYSLMWHGIIEVWDKSYVILDI